MKAGAVPFSIYCFIGFKCVFYFNTNRFAKTARKRTILAVTSCHLASENTKLARQLQVKLRAYLLALFLASLICHFQGKQ